MLIATELDPKVPIIDPVKYVAKIANKAGLSEKTKRKAIGIMNDAITRKYQMVKALWDWRAPFFTWPVL